MAFRKQSRKKYLLAIAITTILLVTIANVALTNAVTDNASKTSFHISVLDGNGNSPNNTNVYIFSNPSTPQWALIYNGTLLTGQSADVLVGPGNYSVGAHQEDNGWAVQTVNVTSQNAGSTLPVLLTLKPVATNYTDNNGTFTPSLNSWTFLKNITVTATNRTALMPVTAARGPILSALANELANSSNPNLTMSSLNVMQPMDNSPPITDPYSFVNQFLVNVAYSSDIPTILGGLYSTAGVQNSLTIGTTTSIDVGYWVQYGPIQTNGATQLTSAQVANVGTVPFSNGQTSGTIKGNFNYLHEEWLVTYFDWWTFTDYTVDYETIEATSMTSLPYLTSDIPPTPYCGMNQAIPTIDHANTAAYPTNQQPLAGTYSTSTSNVQSWSVGMAVSVMPDWVSTGGDLGLGCSWTNVNSGTTSDDVYVYGGRQILVSSPGINSPLVFQNDYWAKTLVSAPGVGNPNAMLSENNNGGSSTSLVATSSGSAMAVVYTAGNNANQEQAHGHVYVYGHAQSGYTNSKLLVYVSNDGQNWGNPIQQVTVNSASGYYIDCGSASSFNYISLCAYYPSGGSPSYLQLNTLWTVSP